MVDLPFPSREQAGKALAEVLKSFSDAKDVTVLALVRGGVIIGRAIADRLKLPLYPLIVRKIGHPDHREFALGAVSEGGSTYLDEETIKAYEIPWEDVEAVIDEEMRELKRRTSLYLPTPRPSLEGKTVILTDDGAATGATLFAAIADLRKEHVAKIIIALPVAPPDTAARLREKADACVILATPPLFGAVGEWYVKFPQVEDEEVLALL